MDNDNIANGVISTNIFTIINLNEYENINDNKDIERVDFIIPSNEKTFNETVSIDIVEFIVLINVEKQISVLNRVSPRLLIDSVIVENKDKNCSNIKYEKFIHVPHITNLNIN